MKYIQKIAVPMVLMQTFVLGNLFGTQTIPDGFYTYPAAVVFTFSFANVYQTSFVSQNIGNVPAAAINKGTVETVTLNLDSQSLQKTLACVIRKEQYWQNAVVQTIIALQFVGEDPFDFIFAIGEIVLSLQGGSLINQAWFNIFGQGKSIEIRTEKTVIQQNIVKDCFRRLPR